jgi:hypothetical protein
MRKKLQQRPRTTPSKSTSARRSLAGNKKPVIMNGSGSANKSGPIKVEDCSKVRCKGATRYGDPCRFWAQPGGEFCYWCEQAGSQRFPLPKPTGEAARMAAIKEVHKKRCQGVTVFGDQCRFWAVGSTDYCLWCAATHNSTQGGNDSSPLT